jgi:hypothetical protein
MSMLKEVLVFTYKFNYSKLVNSFFLKKSISWFILLVQYYVFVIKLIHMKPTFKFQKKITNINNQSILTEIKAPLWSPKHIHKLDFLLHKLWMHSLLHKHHNSVEIDCKDLLAVGYFVTLPTMISLSWLCP